MPLEPRAHYASALRSVVIVHRGESPTADIYLDAPLKDVAVPVRRFDMTAPCAEDAEVIFPAGAFVVIVRYLDRRTLLMLRRRRRELAGVAYLLDDDIPAAWKCRELPLRYRCELAWFWLRYGRAILGLASEVWLCSEGLHRAYGGGERILRVDPAFIREPEAEAPVTIFYHAETSHRQDALWLRDVVSEVQARCNDTVFEIIGGVALKKAFRGIPRCRIVHPMTWGAYLPYASASRFDIGLAPLSPGRFNAGRSFNKLYDITRCGAVGIYAKAGPYGDVVEDGVSGLLCGPESRAWVEEIISLARSPERRRRMQAAARRLVERLSDQQIANPVFRRLCDERLNAGASITA